MKRQALQCTPASLPPRRAAAATTFCFEAEELEMEDGCLPASLRTLCMTWSHYEPLPTAIAHATQLRSLSLAQWWGTDLRCIERLSQLTYLGLSATLQYHDYPPPALRLSAFSELQCLVLGGNERPYPLSLEGASSELQQLTYLNLRRVTPSSQPSLCAGLSMLTSLQVIGTDWSSPSILTPAVLARMQQLRAASLHVQTAITATAVLRALPRLQFLFLHIDIDDDARAGNRQAARPAPADVAALLTQLTACPALKGLHMSSAVHALLYGPELQQLFQPALAKLTAAGIKVQPAPAWWCDVTPVWRAAAGIPAEPDSELCKLLLC